MFDNDLRVDRAAMSGVCTPVPSLWSKLGWNVYFSGSNHNSSRLKVSTSSWLQVQPVVSKRTIVWHFLGWPEKIIVLYRAHPLKWGENVFHSYYRFLF